MAFSYRPLPDRIANCVRQFDYAGEKGLCPKDWRSRVSLTDVRFGNLTNSFPAKVFGSLANARSHSSFRFSMAFYDYGCLADKKNSTTALRLAWSEALTTDKDWKFVNTVYNRRVKGAHFSIIRQMNGWSIYLTKSGEAVRVGSTYKSVASAKRAVRKLTNRI